MSVGWADSKGSSYLLESQMPNRLATTRDIGHMPKRLLELVLCWSQARATATQEPRALVYP